MFSQYPFLCWDSKQKAIVAVTYHLVFIFYSTVRLVLLAQIESILFCLSSSSFCLSDNCSIFNFGSYPTRQLFSFSKCTLVYAYKVMHICCFHLQLSPCHNIPPFQSNGNCNFLNETVGVTCMYASAF